MLKVLHFGARIAGKHVYGMLKVLLSACFVVLECIVWRAYCGYWGCVGKHVYGVLECGKHA